MKSKIIDIALISLLACLALIIVLPDINKAIWYDEACTVDFAKMAPFELIGTLAKGNNLPAYYFFMKAWTGVFGVSEAALRLPGVIFYLLSMCCVYFFGKRLFSGRGPAFASALIYLLLRINTSNALNAKPYPMLALFSILSLMLFYDLFITGKKGRLPAAAYIAVNIAGSFTHVWFFFTALSQGVYYLIIRRRLDRRFVAVFLCSFAPFFIFLSPVLYSQLHSQSNSWMKFYGFELELTFLYFTSEKLLNVLLLFSIPALAGFFAKKYAKKEYAAGKFTGNLFFILTILAVSLFVPYIISFFKPIYNIERGPIIAAAPLALILGGYLCAISYKPLFYAALTLFSLTIYVKLYSAGPIYYNNDRTMAKIVMANASDADNVAFYDELKRPMKYYFNRLHFNRNVVFIDSPDIMGTFRSGEWDGAGDSVKQAFFKKYCDALGDGKKLLFVFQDSDAANTAFKLVFEKLNSSYKIVKDMEFLGITIIKYDLTKKPR